MQIKQTLASALMATTLVAMPLVMTAQPALAFKHKAAPAASGVAVKAGTKINGKLDTTLDSAKNQDGDTFTLTLAPGLFQNKTLKGAVLEGHVEGVKSAAKFGKKGAMDIVFDDLKTTDGKVIPVAAQLSSAPKPQGKMLRNTALVLGGAVVGHHIGKSSGKKHGALMGAMAGGAIALAMPGGNIVLKRGTPLQVKFTQDVALQ